MMECDKKLQIRPRACTVSAGSHRTFFHVDLDAFFASVEQIKNPKLKNKPVIVGGRNSRRGVVAAASYEAKRFGVTTGMPWQQARQKCPNAIFLAADFEAYAEYSEKVQNILNDMAPVVAQASVDESYLDLTGCERIYGTFRRAAEKIHGAVFADTGLSVSIGIAGSQSVSKMASKLAKPCGMMEVPKGAEAKFLSPFPVETMPGIGPQIGERLKSMGILTLGQLAAIPSSLLRTSFGIYGPFLKSKAMGKDTWELEVTEVIKSVGKQETFEEDVSDWETIRRKLFCLIEKVGQKLRGENLYARRICVFVRYADFTTSGVSKTIPEPSHFDRVLSGQAETLMKPLVVRRKPVRLIGFTAQNLIQKTPQLDLFRTAKSERWERFYSSLDRLKQKLPTGSFRVRI
ncbi:MAG: DNA polymerase IV [Deltaproteobacteria bacterium]|nr:DNA polymerase IV [Deltaproteobacteria bacterium]